MAKRRLKKILDLSCAKDKNNSETIAGIISSFTIVFGENFYSGEHNDDVFHSDTIPVNK